MNLNIFLCLPFVIFSCSADADDKPLEKIERKTNNVANKDYSSRKKSALAIKEKYREIWKQMSAQNKGKIFTEAIVEEIIPGWLGTPWDYNGVTQDPPNGKIACGYFVTTVLRDAGCKISRTKLAQCASEQMITTLVKASHVKRFSNAEFSDFENSIKTSGYGLYIVGLDNHTGFIYNNGNQIYFIHAGYIGEKVVTKDIANQSPILYHSKYKVLGHLSADKAFVDKWMYEY